MFLFNLFSERREGWEKEGEKLISIDYLHIPLTGHLACNPGMCPDQELNWWPFGLKASTQPTEPHQPGHKQKLF